MQQRLNMQDEGITDPSAQVKDATKSLVEKLSCIEASEKINIEIINDTTAKYIRASSGEG